MSSESRESLDKYFTAVVLFLFVFFGWLFFCKGRKTLYVFLISLYFKNLSEGGQTNFLSVSELRA